MTKANELDHSSITSSSNICYHKSININIIIDSIRTTKGGKQRRETGEMIKQVASQTAQPGSYFCCCPVVRGVTVLILMALWKHLSSFRSSFEASQVTASYQIRCEVKHVQLTARARARANIEDNKKPNIAIHSYINQRFKGWIWLMKSCQKTRKIGLSAADSYSRQEVVPNNICTSASRFTTYCSRMQNACTSKCDVCIYA